MHDTYDKEIFKETFSVLHASEDTLAEVFKMTTQRKKHFRVLRIVPIAAAVTLLLGMTVALAVGFTQYDNPIAMLRAFFGENFESKPEGIATREVTYEYSEDGEIIAKDESGMLIPGWERVPVDEKVADEQVSPYIYGQNVSLSWEGYTLTVEACFYDRHTGGGLLYYTLENPDGIEGYVIDVKGYFGWLQEVGCIFTMSDKYGEMYLDEAQSTETKLYICEYFVNHDWGVSDNWRTELVISMGMREGDPDAFYGEGELVVYESATIPMIPGDEMPALSLDNDNVQVSAIGIRINEDAYGVIPGSYMHYIALRFGDGSEYVLKDSEGFIDNSMYALGTQNSTESAPQSAPDGNAYAGEPTPAPDPIGGYSSTYLFNRLVDIENLTEIVLDGTVVRVR